MQLDTRTGPHPFHAALQGEDRAALNLASLSASPKLTLRKDDMVLYSAKVIPGNNKKVSKMMNRISHMGCTIANDRADGLHTRCALRWLLLCLGP